MIDLPPWLDPTAPYLVGISGGRDSIALHHWLVQNQFEELTYCHLNHQLRDSESDGDQAFLENLLGPALLTKKLNVAELATTQKISLETAARQARHTFFQDCAHKTGINQILLAHHADDQAETILFNLLRGSSGLKGMQNQRTIDELTYLRPLLSVRRSEIDQFLGDKAYREDSTNAEPFATRNRLRNEALPLLTKIFKKDPTISLLRAHQNQTELDLFLNDTLANITLLDPQGRIHLPTLRGLNPVLQKRALHQYLQNHHIPDISQALVQNALTLLDPQQNPAVINLPGGLRLRRKESRLFISS